jgi:hypothetical protein
VQQDVTTHQLWRETGKEKVIPFPVIFLFGIIITVIGFNSSTMLYVAAPFVTYFGERYTHK